MYIASLVFFLFALLLPTLTAAWTASDTEGLLNKMEAAYVGIDDYQTRLEIKDRQGLRVNIGVPDSFFQLNGG